MSPRKPPTSTSPSESARTLPPKPTEPIAPGGDGAGSTDLHSRVHRELEKIDTALGALEDQLGLDTRLTELGMLAPMFAHEVNNLMMQVGGRAQRALAHPDRAPEVERALRLAVDASRQVAQLGAIFLDSIPSVSGADAISKAEPDPCGGSCAGTDCDRGHCVREIHQQALRFMSQHDLEAFKPALVESEAGIEVAVLPMLIQQVLLNLYLNAARALRGQDQDDRSEPPRIITRVERAQRAHDCSTGNTQQIRIVVEDNGPGMSPAQIQRAMYGLIPESRSTPPTVYQAPPPPPPPSRPPPAGSDALAVAAGEHRDAQQHEDRGARCDGEHQEGRTPGTERSQSEHGNGLGLAVCRRLLSHAGGGLSCESSPGLGTRMIITVPGGIGLGRVRRCA